MSQLLNGFLQLQVLVAVGGALAVLLRALGRSRFSLLSARTELRLHYLMLALVGIFLVLPFQNQGSFRFEPIARVVASSPSPGTIASDFSSSLLVAAVSTKTASGISLANFSFFALLALLAGLAAVLGDYLRLWNVLRKTVVFRRIGKVKIAVGDEVTGAFSVRGLFSAWVVLPPSILANSRSTRIAVAHELQHHRSRDTLFCHLFAPLRALSFFNPLRALWASALMEAQELACDEALVTNQKRISAREYSECLVQAAETAGKGKAGRVYAAAPALFSNRRLLKRRIEAMYMTTNRPASKWTGYVLGLTLSISLGASAWASGEFLVDSRITMEQAENMAAEARKTTDFPIAVNDVVLEKLNHFLGTPGGREYVRQGVARMEALRPRMETKLALYRAPAELLAVGMIESGFENLPPSQNQVAHAAGIWQFMASTARVFGMRVDETVDERMDIDVETDAAFRYLTANKMRFNDWLLGVMAYNMGERALDNAIQKAGTRDAWELVKQGYENDAKYLAKFMAMVIILKNPQALR